MNATEAAACYGMDPAIFFPEGEWNSPGYENAPAKLVCAGCDVRSACLQLAMDAEADVSVWGRWGIYGGLDPEQRANLARMGVADVA